MTTEPNAVAQVRLADPGPVGARVTLRVSLGAFAVPAITVDVPAYGEAQAVITPNSSIPAAGLAVVRLSSSVPVVASLAAGTAAGVALTPSAAPTGLALLGGFDPVYSRVLIANASASAATDVRVVRSFAVAGCAPAPRVVPGHGSFRVGAAAVWSAIAAIPAVGACGAVIVSSNRPDMVVAQVLVTVPAGVAVVSGSPG